MLLRQSAATIDGIYLWMIRSKAVSLGEADIVEAVLVQRGRYRRSSVTRKGGYRENVSLIVSLGERRIIEAVPFRGRYRQSSLHERFVREEILLKRCGLERQISWEQGCSEMEIWLNQCRSEHHISSKQCRKKESSSKQYQSKRQTSLKQGDSVRQTLQRHACLEPHISVP